MKILTFASKGNIVAIKPSESDLLTSIDEASFLWFLRSVALEQPFYLPAQLQELDDRLDKALAKLYAHPVEVWKVCEGLLENLDPGRAFVTAAVAFHSLEAPKIQRVVESVATDEQNKKGVISAIAWLPKEIVFPWLDKFMRSKVYEHKYIALSVYSSLRVFPGDVFPMLMHRPESKLDPAFYSRCLRLIGELKLFEYGEHIRRSLESDDVHIRFWGAWSGILHGEPDALKTIYDYVVHPGPYQDSAIALFFRKADDMQAKEAISHLANQEDKRKAIMSAAVLGDPQVIPWLIHLMENPDWSRAAGEAFSHVTGIYLEENNLALDIPEIDVFPKDITEIPAREFHPDETLPWPDLEKIKAVWNKYGGHYSTGKRYFLGKPIYTEHLKRQFYQGFQRQRISASYELALLERSSVMPNAKAKISSL